MRSAFRFGDRRRIRVLLGATIVSSLLASFISDPAQAAPAVSAAVPRTLTAAAAVAAPDGLVAYYPFTKIAGDGVATNFAAGGDGTVQAGASQVDGFEPPELGAGVVLQLDGAAGAVSSPVVLATDKSFSVAAWVKPDQVNRSQALVSQDGSRVSAFTLKLDANGTWAFAMPQGDGDSAAVDVARGPAAVAGEWTHLAGVFDASVGEMRLYVNGTKVATAKHTVTWVAGGQLQAGRGLRAAAKVDFVGGSLDDVRAWSSAVSPEAVTDAVVDPSQQRRGWCTVGNWLQASGPVGKATAGTALSSSAYDRAVAVRWKVPGIAGGSVMENARRTDWAAYDQVVSARSTRLNPVFAYLNGLTMKDTADDATFRTQPAYAAVIDKFLINNRDDDAAFESKYVNLPSGTPNAQALARALAIAADMRAHPAQYHVPVIVGTPLVPSDGTIRTWSANRVAAWLRFGGYPFTAPEAGSAEFRFEVESAKLTWSDCDSGDPQGTYTPQSTVSAGGSPLRPEPGPLAEVTRTAHREWAAELAAQTAPRNAIVAAEIQANKDLRTATEAMLEAQYEAWVAGQLLKWQTLWLGRAKTYPGYPVAADFTRVKNAIAAIPAAVQTQLTSAQTAVTSANAQVTKVDTAKTQAADIATANGTPLYRGLAYAQQSAQVTKASASAAQAASGAIQTTLNAVKATNADAKALQALAATQQAAQQAEFRRKAAQEAAAQAKAAADAAAKQAKAAAEQAAIAKAKRAVAEQALATAKTTAAKAAQHRQIAEQQQQIAAQQRSVAQQRHAEAAAADADAQRQRDIAQQADADARTQEATAGSRAQDAENQAQAAASARADADRAKRDKNATRARAAALDAAADAAEGTSNATAARAAADAAQADADRADAAADAAEADAQRASAAAVAAREAATRARAAATKARAAANAAARDAAATRAAAATAHSAAADALAASHNAAADADAAKALAAQARADADKAAADSAAAQKAAADARASSAVTAAEAHAAAAWATAARDAAVTVIAPANDAIALGGPFQQTDAAAGLAVLIGQESKTVADQQAAAATAAADEAARAAATAAALAAQATADAKVAAQAAADAAASAAAAAKSAAAAQASAAAAAKDAAAAAAADSQAAELARQATRDAAAADGAATAVERDADAADSEADAAERNAASARQAAADARAAAIDAQAAADQANKYAEEAEAAAARARESAQAAEDAADQAEKDANTQADAAAAGPDAPTGMENLIAEPHNLVDRVDQVDCYVIDLRHCQATVTHHVSGQIVYFARTCPDEGVTNCPGRYTDDYLTTITLDNKPFTETRIFDPMQITLDFWKAIGKAFVQDFVDCYHGQLIKCGILAAEFLAPLALGAVVKAVVGLRIAMRTGRGMVGAFAALEASGVEASAMSKLTREALRVAAKCEGNSFAAGTLVLLADGRTKPIEDVRVGDLVRAGDPRTGATRAEPVTALINHGGPHVMVDVGLAGGGVLRATDHHPFWDATRGDFVDAIDLATGDELLTADGHRAVVSSVTTRRADLVAYNLTVADLHTYYVLGGATPVLVHNAACDDIALGLAEANGNDLALVEFAMERGALPYSEWPGSGPWYKKLLAYLADGSTTKISMNLDGIEDVAASARAGAKVDPAGYEGLTNWELYQISKTPSSWSRITFYRGGRTVANPFE